jgi:hypothetical protein
LSDAEGFTGLQGKFQFKQTSTKQLASTSIRLPLDAVIDNGQGQRRQNAAGSSSSIELDALERIAEAKLQRLKVEK